MELSAAERYTTIYFDSIDNSAYILGKAKHSARNTWIYIREEEFEAVRVDVGGDPSNDDVPIAWKMNRSAKDTWLGPEQSLGTTFSLYCLTMDPYEKYDMLFNGAAEPQMPTNESSWHETKTHETATNVVCKA